MRDDLQDLVDEVSRLLGAPATLEDREFTLLAFCAHDDEQAGSTMDAVRTRSILGRGSTPQVRAWFEGHGITTATGPLRVPGDPAAGILTRLCLPVRADGRLHGYLWLLDGGRTDVGDPASPGLAEATALAADAGRLLAAGRPGTADLPAALREALTGGPQRAVRVLAEALGATTPVTLVALRPAAPGLPEGWRPPGAGAVATVLDDGAAVAVLLPLAGSDDARPAGALAAAALAGLPAGSTAGVAAARPGCGELSAQWAEAQTAARVAAVDRALAPAAAWAELGAWRQVAQLRAPDPALAPLLADPVLTETAAVWLDCAGSPQRAAARLCIHRQTLYYRLARIGELTGLDLADGADRLLVHLGIRVAQLTGTVRSRSASPEMLT